MLPDLKAERARIDARQGYKRKRADRRHFNTAWMRTQPGRVYFGPDSVTVASKHMKYVRPNRYFPFTPGELARVYLDDLMRRTLGNAHLTAGFRFSDRDKQLLEIPAPLYFAPERGREGRFVYIDIVAAYFELFARLPLNLAYNPDTDAIGWPRPACQIPECDVAWLRAEKPLRHALFGMMSSSGVSYFQDGQPKQNAFKPAYSAPDLHALVKTRLRKIAKAAVDEFDCRMWLTDAGIFPAKSEFAAWLLSEWGLHSRVKVVGGGHLYALGDYCIGVVRSRMAHVDLGGFSNL